MYNPMSPPHVSTSFKPCSSSAAPRFKAYENVTHYKSNSFYNTVFLQLLLTVWFSQTVTKMVTVTLHTELTTQHTGTTSIKGSKIN